MARDSSDIEEDAERARGQLEDTLDTLRARLTPSGMAEEVMDLARGGGSDLISGVADLAKKNPLPVALVAAGIAMFLRPTGRRPADRGDADGAADRYAHPAYTEVDRRIDTVAAVDGFEGKTRAMTKDITPRADPADETAGAVAALTDDAARKAEEKAAALVEASLARSRRDAEIEGKGIVRRQVEKIRHTVEDAAERVHDTYDDYTDRMKHKASDTIDDVRDYARDARRTVRRKVSRTVDAHPLVLAGIGLAIGAAIGAALPRTRTETRLAGEAARRAKRIAEEEFARAQAAAHDYASDPERAAREANR